MENVTNVTEYDQQKLFDGYLANGAISDYFLVNFTSDSTVNKRGFRIEYYIGNEF